MTGKYSARNMILCALFAALTAVGAFIRIPLPGIPITLQTMFVLLAGLLLGAKSGAVSVAVYVILGLIGLPIFTQGGGPGYVLVPTFGYLIGFILGAFAAGRLAERWKKPSAKQLFAANLAGIGCIYLIGMTYFYVLSNFVLDTPIAFWPLLMTCFVPVIPGDLLTCVICAWLGKRLIPVVREEGK